MVSIEGWQPISEYNRERYDWVLVKYFDRDFECVLEVAEQRVNGKWYNSSEKEIPFDIIYFFDIQQLDEESEISKLKAEIEFLRSKLESCYKAINQKDEQISVLKEYIDLSESRFTRWLRKRIKK